MITSGSVGWTTALTLAEPDEGPPPGWIVALRGGAISDLRAMAFQRWDAGDLEGALPLYRGLTELEPDVAFWPLETARLASWLDRCDEGLILVGRAPTFYVKQLAQHAVKRLTRVPIVRNEIEVAWAIEA